VDHIALDEQSHSGAQQQGVGHRRGSRQRDEWVQRAVVHAWQLAAPGKRCLLSHRNVAVIVHKKRIETALLQCLGQRGGPDTPVRHKRCDANLLDLSLSERCRGWMAEAGFRECYVQHLVGPESMVVGLK
jgi:hypothetical protein